MKKGNYRGKCFCVIYLTSALLLLSIIGCFLYSFYHSHQSMIHDMLMENTKANEDRYHHYIEEKTELLRSLAIAFEQTERPLENPQLLEYLKKVNQTAQFLRMAVIDENGTAYTTDNKTYDFFDNEIFQKGMRAEVVVSELAESEVDGNLSAVIGVPLFRGIRVVGVLTGTISAETLSEELNLTGYREECNVLIFNPYGDILVNCEELKSYHSIFNYITKQENEKMVTKLQKDLLDRKQSTTTFSVSGELFFAYYRPIEQSQNYVINIVPQKVVCAQNAHLMETMIWLIVCILGVFILTAAGLHCAFRKRLLKLKKSKDPLL